MEVCVGPFLQWRFTLIRAAVNERNDANLVQLHARNVRRHDCQFSDEAGKSRFPREEFA